MFKSRYRWPIRLKDNGFFVWLKSILYYSVIILNQFKICDIVWVTKHFSKNFCSPLAITILVQGFTIETRIQKAIISMSFKTIESRKPGTSFTRIFFRVASFLAHRLGIEFLRNQACTLQRKKFTFAKYNKWNGIVIKI